MFCILIGAWVSNRMPSFGFKAWKQLSKFLALTLARYLWFCIAIIYMSCYLASQLSCCVYRYKYSYKAIFFIKAKQPNKIFPILLAFDLKELQIICKPRHMKCFQTIFSNSYLLTSSYFFPDVSLARLGLMFTCRKKILFYVEFSSLPFSS